MLEIFGSSSYPDFSIEADPADSWFEISFALNDFKDVDQGGEILGGLGISDLDTNNAEYSNGLKAVNIFYAMILMIIQAQADNINADPEQKIYVSEQPVRLGSGSRSGQIQRSFTVSFFSQGNVEQIADIDDI